MKTLSSFTTRQPIQISGKGVTSGFFVTGDGVYDTWEKFIAGVRGASKIKVKNVNKKRMKIVPVCEAFTSSRRVFSIQIFGVMPPN